MAPAVFVQKKPDELNNYCELNKKTKKDSYPLPLPEDQLGPTVRLQDFFDTGSHWQLTVHSNDCEKIAFCPGPGLSGIPNFEEYVIWTPNLIPMPHE